MYLKATPDLRLTFRRESEMGAEQLGFDLKTYVDADYTHQAEDRRSVSGAVICGVRWCLVSLGRRSASLDLSLRQNT